MKKISFILIAVLSVSFARAQYYYIPHLTTTGTNPGNLNNDAEYPLGGGQAGGWTTVISGNQATPIWSTAQAIPFAFNFNGLPVTHFKASSTGVLTFDTATVLTAPSNVNTVLPDATIPDQSVCMWGLDVNTTLTHTVSIVSKTFGTTPNRQFWITYSGVGIPGQAGSWVFWSVVLNESSNNIYIVDQRANITATSLTLGIQINNTTATSVSASPNVAALTGGGADATDNVYYEFIYGTQPAYDASVFSVTMANYLLLTQAPFTISCTLQNFGSTALTDVKLNYTVNGGSTVTSAAIPVTIASLASASVSSPMTWTPTATGTFVINVWASDLNGNPDALTANDALSKSTIVVNAVAQRIPCFEVFTSATCGPCAGAAPNLEAVFTAETNKFSCIKYQMNWPGAGDIYYNSDGNTRKSYYGVSGIPDMFVDGVEKNEGTYTTGQLDAEYAVPSFMEVLPTFTVEGKKVTIEGKINPLADFPSSTNLRMHIGIVEKLTTGNIATNGETEFHFVEQKMVPSGSGTLISPLTENVPYIINKNYTFPASSHVEEFTDLLVMVFVQNNSTREIYQSAFALYGTSINDMDKPGTGIVKLFPNPVSREANLMYQLGDSRNVSVSIVNVLGEEVYFNNTGKRESGVHDLKLDTHNLPAGIYSVKLNLGDKVHTTKLLKVE